MDKCGIYCCVTVSFSLLSQPNQDEIELKVIVLGGPQSGLMNCFGIFIIHTFINVYLTQIITLKLINKFQTHKQVHNWYFIIIIFADKNY